MPPKKAEEAAAPPAADDDGLAELATRALPPAFDDDALAALDLLAESEEKYEDDDGKLLPAPLAVASTCLSEASAGAAACSSEAAEGVPRFHRPCKMLALI